MANIILERRRRSECLVAHNGSMARVFDLPDSLVKRAEELAREDGVSLDV